MRTVNTSTVQEAVNEYPPAVTAVDIPEWLSSSMNVALTDDEGNVSMFEWELPGVYSGHYFFRKHTRGSKAIRKAKEFLNEFFLTKPDAVLIKGLTPITHKGALWLSAHLGFKKYGTVPTPSGDCMLFILQRKEFMNE